MNAECFPEEEERSNEQDEVMQDLQDGNRNEGGRDRIAETADEFKSKVSGHQYQGNKMSKEVVGGGGASSSSTSPTSNRDTHPLNPLATAWHPAMSPPLRPQTDDEHPSSLDESTAGGESEEQPMEEVIFASNQRIAPASNEHLPDLHRPLYTKEGVAYEAYKERFHREREERGEGTQTRKIMIPGIHDLPLFKIVDGPGEVYAVERRQAGFDSLKVAQEKVYRLFAAPFEKGISHTNLEALVEQSGSDFVRAIFKLDIGPKLPFDRFYLKDDLIQFFTLDPRRAKPSVHYAMERASC